MANYKETPFSGSTWIRAVSVRIENPYNDAPTITFDEENLYVIGDEIIHRPVLGTLNGSLKEHMGDPTMEFDIIDPQTDEFIRKATYMEVYATVYSLYKTLALRRDAMPPLMPPVKPEPALEPTPVA